MAHVIVIGGGVVGLSSAWYLQRAGHSVTVLDKDDFSDNCSYGNAGYVCPSHFVPLAQPGMVKLGLKWMFNPQSPFFIEPRADMGLLRWAWLFMRHANAGHVAKSAVPLRDIALISQLCYREMHEAGIDMAYEERGLLEVFQTADKEHHGVELVEQSKKLGLDARMMSADEVRELEPDVRMNLRGAVWFGCDGHLYPNKLMSSLRQSLRASGVQLIGNSAVTNFRLNGRRIEAVQAGAQWHEGDEVVLAAGSWSPELASKLRLTLPIVGGRGYSVTLEDSPYRIHHPIILQEGRVAITPMDGNKLRFGGTMEITSLNRAPRYERVKGIAAGVKRFMPDVDVPTGPPEKVWTGYRPVSADGLPYIGRPGGFQNLVVATGHAMIGLSLGAGTGQIVAQLVAGEKPSMDLQPFHPDRFR